MEPLTLDVSSTCQTYNARLFLHAKQNPDESTSGCGEDSVGSIHDAGVAAGVEEPAPVDEVLVDNVVSRSFIKDSTTVRLL